MRALSEVRLLLLDTTENEFRICATQFAACKRYSSDANRFELEHTFDLAHELELDIHCSLRRCTVTCIMCSENTTHKLARVPQKQIDRITLHSFECNLADAK